MPLSYLFYRPMSYSDLASLSPIIKRSFDDDAKVSFHQETGGPIGYDDGSLLRRYIEDLLADAYCICLQDEVIGGMIVKIDEEQKMGHLELLFIDPIHMGQGYGYQAWLWIEDHYSFVEKWITNTPAVSFRNHCFYVNKCGFHVTGIAGGKDPENAWFILKKIRI